ncbi:MAG: tetratricopeptide repeat protein, partial [Phycisphaerales bacterium]
ARRSVEPRRLGKLVRGELDWIVMKALEKDRQRRYDSAGGFAADIRRYLDGEAVLAAPPSGSYRLRKFVRRNKSTVLAAGAVAAALLAGVVGFAWQARAVRQQRDLALAAQGAERVAKEQAQKRLAQIEKGNRLLSSVFRDLDPAEIAQSGRPLQAVLVDHLDRAAADLDNDAVGDPLVVAGLQFDLGKSLTGLGEPVKGAALMEKARATCERELGPDNGDTLTASNDLAMAYYSAGDYERAQKLMEETLGRRRALQGPSHAETVTCLSNLALIYQRQKRYSDAIGMLKEVLDLRKVSDGPTGAETGNATHNLAIAYQEFGEAQTALPLAKEALILRRKNLGDNHPFTINTMRMLASCYYDTGDVVAARPMLEDAFSRARATLGADHPITLSMVSDLVKLYYNANEIDKVRDLLEECVPLMKAKLGEDHHQTLRSTQNLAAIYWKQDNLAKSIPLFESTVRSSERRLGHTNIDTQMAIANLGVNYASAGRTADALPLLEETFEVSKSNAEVRFARQTLFDCYLASGNAPKAAAIVDGVVEYIRASTPAGPRLAGALATIGSGLLQLNLCPQAEGLLREALTIREREAPDMWTTFNTKSLLGGALMGQGRFAEAEPLLLAGYEGIVQREASLPAGSPRLVEAVDRLVTLYSKLEKPDEVARWRGEREKHQVTAAPAKK